MTTYGESLYGIGLYGYESVDVVEDVLVTSSNQISIKFVGNIFITSALLNPATYELFLFDTFEAAPVLIKGVLPINNNDTKYVDRVELDVAGMKDGTTYILKMNPVFYTKNTQSLSSYTKIKWRTTKTDAILNSLPEHFSLANTSNIRHLLTAISSMDDEIGGSRKDSALTFKLDRDFYDVALASHKPLTINGEELTIYGETIDV